MTNRRNFLHTLPMASPCSALACTALALLHSVVIIGRMTRNPLPPAGAARWRPSSHVAVYLFCGQYPSLSGGVSCTNRLVSFSS